MLGLFQSVSNTSAFDSVETKNQDKPIHSKKDEAEAKGEKQVSLTNDDDRYKPLEETILQTSNCYESDQMTYSECVLSSGFTFRIPSIIGKYKVIKIIGKGGFSVVVLLEMIGTDTLYAGKLYSIQDMKDRNISDMIHQEVEFLSSSCHPGIIKMHGHLSIKDDNNKEYFVIILDFLKQGDLAEILKTNCVKPDCMKKFLVDIVDAVLYIHENGMAHCDIKTANILVNSLGGAVLTDFGFITKMKSTTSTKCTIMFAAPEIRRLNGPYNPKKSDIWALGVTLYFIATKQYPYLKYEHIVEYRIENKLSYVKDPLLRDLIRRCLRVNPDERLTIKEVRSHEFFS